MAEHESEEEESEEDYSESLLDDASPTNSSVQLNAVTAMLASDQQQQPNPVVPYPSDVQLHSSTTVAHNCHIKYKLLTSNTNCSHQIQIAHIKHQILTSKTNCSHQKQIAHIKYKLLTSNTKS